MLEIINLLKRLGKAYLVFALANVVYKLYYHYQRRTRAIKLLKHVPGKNFDDRLGLRLAKNILRHHDYWKDHTLKYPQADLIKTQGPAVEIVCNTPRAIEWMLKSEFSKVTKPGSEEDYLFYLFGRFVGADGIFNLRHGSGKLVEENAKWNAQRKITSLIFTKNNFMQNMHQVFCQKCDNLINVLAQKAKNNCAIDMQEKFFAFTMDSIQKIFFGFEVDTVKSGYADPFAKAFDSANEKILRILLSTGPMLILSNFLLPWPFGTLIPDHYVQNSLFMQYLQSTNPDFLEFENSIATIDTVLRKTIKKIREDPNYKSRGDIIARFLSSKYGETLDDKTLRDILLNLTIAGRDTTACTLSWMFYMLTQNKDIQRKLQEEIDQKLGDRDPKLEDLTPEHMPYLNGVLYETLRLYPPVPEDVKIVTEDIVFLDGKTVIPKSARLIFNNFAMGKNPTIYPDPMKVDPNRWIPFKQPSLYEFPVFQAGPRFCLGKDMAQFEAKLVAAKLLRKFDFELLEGEAEKISYSFNITMSITNSERKDSHCLWIKPKLRTVQ